MCGIVLRPQEAAQGQLWAKPGRKRFKKQSELEPDFEGQEVGCMLLLGVMTGRGVTSVA